MSVCQSNHPPSLSSNFSTTGGITEQTEQVFANIKAILSASNAQLTDVVKATGESVAGGLVWQGQASVAICQLTVSSVPLVPSPLIFPSVCLLGGKLPVFLKDMNHFAELNAVYGKYFGHKPARSCVEVARLPKDVLVEVSGHPSSADPFARTRTRIRTHTESRLALADASAHPPLSLSSDRMHRSGEGRKQALETGAPISGSGIGCVERWLVVRVLAISCNGGILFVPLSCCKTLRPTYGDAPLWLAMLHSPVDSTTTTTAQLQCPRQDPSPTCLYRGDY